MTPTPVIQVGFSAYSRPLVVHLLLSVGGGYLILLVLINSD